MKRFLKLSMLLATVLTISACRAGYQDGPHKVYVDDDQYHGGHFCPPGQAKKGNC